MNPRGRAFLQIVILVCVFGGLMLAFPGAFALAEMAARELRYFWWIILLLALAGWFIWGFRKRP